MQSSTPHSQQLTTSAASEEWIVGRVTTLLSHYFQPSEDLAVTRAAMGDWLEDLHGFSEATIEAACKGHRRQDPNRRPTPGGIRNRALAYLDHETSMGRLPRPSLPTAKVAYLPPQPRVETPSDPRNNPEQVLLDVYGSTEIPKVRRMPKCDQVPSLDTDRLTGISEDPPPMNGAFAGAMPRHETLETDLVKAIKEAAK